MREGGREGGRGGGRGGDQRSWELLLIGLTGWGPHKLRAEPEAVGALFLIAGQR